MNDPLVLSASGIRGVANSDRRTTTFVVALFEKHSSDSVVTILTKGKNEDVKSFKGKLSQSEMVAVAAYIRSFGQK